MGQQSNAGGLSRAYSRVNVYANRVDWNGTGRYRQARRAELNCCHIALHQMVATGVEGWFFDFQLWEILGHHGRDVAALNILVLGRLHNAIHLSAATMKQAGLMGQVLCTGSQQRQLQRNPLLYPQGLQKCDHEYESGQGSN